MDDPLAGVVSDELHYLISSQLMMFLRDLHVVQRAHSLCMLKNNLDAKDVAGEIPAVVIKQFKIGD